MKTLASLVAASALAAPAFAHTIFQELYVNGVDQGHLTGIRVPDYDGPIMDVTSNDIICNGGINPYHQPISQAVIPVPAGASVTAEWHHTLAGADPSDPADPVDPSHKGPVMAYLAKVSNATSLDVTGLGWFKIWEDGMDSSQVWGVDRMIANKGKVTFQIPDCIEAGQYLLRVEMIALHGAESYPGAQFYMECAQIQITGGGSKQPATVSFPGAYHGTDPGITINIYQKLSSYTIPGPSVFSCDAPSSPTSPISTTPVPPSSTPVSTPSSPSSTPTSPVGTVPHYGQCGGLTYTGPTACESPYSCVVSNEYYSQCL
ncbi:glycosyl hydrolase family 61-domain-containing protein [Cubamyces lactineus]|nr:glycosyl hydrolase family 61-domain-containing protein [Cubamyces lactineus]